MQFLVGSYTCDMSLDDDGKVVTTWRLGDGRGTEAPKYLNRAERNQYQAGRKAFLESLEDHPSTRRQAQDRRPRRKAQGNDSSTKTSIIFTVAVAALASGLIGGATAA